MEAMGKIRSVCYAEAWAGEGVNAAHINLAVGPKGSAIEQGILQALAMPRAGTIPYFTVLQPNYPVKPFTLFVNKADLRGERHAQLTWGPAQAGVAEGVLDAVADDIIPKDDVDQLLILVAVWVDWQAENDDLVYQNNRTATRQAIERAVKGIPRVEDVLAARQMGARNPFLTGGVGHDGK
jgi:5,6,7,8-tetrahydromethanopterin hydro-lyase